VQVAGEARAFGEHSFELQVGGLARGHRDLQLGGALDHLLLEGVVGLLQLFLCRLERGVFPRNGQQPEHNQDKPGAQ